MIYIQTSDVYVTMSQVESNIHTEEGHYNDKFHIGEMIQLDYFQYLLKLEV